MTGSGGLMVVGTDHGLGLYTLPRQSRRQPYCSGDSEKMTPIGRRAHGNGPSVRGPIRLIDANGTTDHLNLFESSLPVLESSGVCFPSESLRRFPDIKTARFEERP